MTDYVPIILGIAAICIYVVQLWTGVAVIGGSGEQPLLERNKRPGPYWFVMAIQTLVLFVVPVLIYFFG